MREEELTSVQALQRMIVFQLYTVAELLEPLYLFLPATYAILINKITEGTNKEVA